MTANRVLLLIVPLALMLAAIFGLAGMETGLAGLGKTAAQKLAYARAGMALPSVAAAGIGLIFFIVGLFFVIRSFYGMRISTLHPQAHIDFNEKCDATPATDLAS